MTSPEPCDSSITIEAPFNLTAWQLLAGASLHPPCGVPVAWVSVEDDNGDLTGERRLCEFVQPPEFGVEHTPSRCRSSRQRRQETAR